MAFPRLSRKRSTTDRIARDDRVVIDLQHEETEEGWLRLWDRTALAVAPRWFEWLGWVAALAALRFIHRKSGNGWLLIPILISSGLMLTYFNAFFHRFYLVGTTRRRNPRLEHVITIVLSTLLTWTAYYFAGFLSDAISKQAP
jgi:hypothetical protein